MKHTRIAEYKVSDNRRVTFYPIVFNEVTTIHTRNGSYLESLHPNVFDSSLANPKVEVIATIDHKPELTIAKRSDNSLVLQKDSHGIFASCWVPDGELGDKVIAGIAAGDITGCSCGWDNGAHHTRSDGVMEWTAGELFDVTIVMNGEPAYKTTEVHLRSSVYKNSIIAKYNYLNFRLKYNK